MLDLAKGNILAFNNFDNWNEFFQRITAPNRKTENYDRTPHIQIRDCRYKAELVWLGGLAHLCEISPSLRNFNKNIMCSYEK